MKYWPILLILSFAFFLRVYKVDKIPPSLSWDEVSIGYNAYSILKTGKDEHGKFLPLDAFTSYGDYKPPLPIYITAPFVGLFGLNELAVRLPSVIAGTATVLVFYLFIVEVIPGLLWFPEVGCLLLAISPWHIQLSRGGFEANIALFFIILGSWLVIRSKINKKLLWVAWLPFVAAIYTFNSARYFAPLLALGLAIFSWDDIKKHRRALAGGIVISILALLPILPHLFSKEARLRFAEVNIFTDASVVATSNERMAYDHNNLFGKIFHNRRIGYALSYLNHYSDFFQPWFLFTRGDGNPKFSIQDVGELYIIEIPFLIYGIYVLFFKKSKLATLLLFWLLASLIAPSTARETPHALRAENALPVFLFFTSFGLISIFQKIHKASGKKIFVGCMVFLYLLILGYYFHNYYTHYPKEYSGEWQYGYREAIRFVQPLKDQYKQIVIAESIGRAYMYTLFYEKYDPEAYWRTKDGGFDAAGFLNIYGFDKYRFVKDVGGQWQKNTLYVLRPQEVPAGARKITTINLLNGTVVLVVFDI